MASQSTRRCPICKITPLRTGNECTHCMCRRIQEEAFFNCFQQTKKNYYQINTYLSRILNGMQKQQEISSEFIQNGEKKMNYILQKGKYIRNPTPSLNPGPKPFFSEPENCNVLMYCNESDLPDEEFIVPRPVICPACQKSFDEKPGFRIDSRGNIVHNCCHLPKKNN